MKYQINLFSRKDKNIIDKVIYFSFHYLRYILVITQIVVIGVFFYRFKVDQEIVDLKESLNQKKEILTIARPLIDEVRAIERSGQYVKDITGEQKKSKDTLNYFLSIFPENMTLERFEILTDGTITFSGTSSDPNTVRLFYNRLKKDNKFAVVKLGNLKKDLFGFSFSVALSNGQSKLTP